jgi:predicted DNA-binding transcriptional regulator YafY
MAPICGSLRIVDTNARRDELARLLKRGGHRTVDELVRTLGASRRTVLRDLGALRARGYRIEGEGGPGGGVRMDPDTVMLSGHLAAEEVVGLIVSVALLLATPWMPFASEAERALTMIEKSLPGLRARELRRLLERVLVGEPASGDVAGVPGAVDRNVLGQFERAFREQLILAFEYRDREGRSSRRRVEPQALLVRAPLWYVIAWDASRDALRLFRMDRIQHPSVVEGQQFERRALALVAGVCPDARQARAAAAV